MGYLDMALKIKVEERIKENFYILIDQTIGEINRSWEAGALGWIKANRPDEWEKMVTLEGEINEMALGGNLNGLREALSEYQGRIFAMVREFKDLRETKEQESFNFLKPPLPHEVSEKERLGLLRGTKVWAQYGHR